MPRNAPILRGTILALAALALAGLGGTVACGTEAVGVDACRKIEKVRCESAGACGIDLIRPVHAGEGPKADVAACTRYYDDQCLHGLVMAKEPGAQAVDACVDAIINGDCSVVEAPETAPACAFLVPPETPTPSDAGDDGGTQDADADP